MIAQNNSAATTFNWVWVSFGKTKKLSIDFEVLVCLILDL